MKRVMFAALIVLLCAGCERWDGHHVHVGQDGHERWLAGSGWQCASVRPAGHHYYRVKAEEEVHYLPTLEAARAIAERACPSDEWTQKTELPDPNY
jgi:hypothetical protein